MEKIYELRWNADHLVDIEYDIFHMPFENDILTNVYLFGGKRFSLPDKFLFSGDFDSVGEFDYITNDLRIPILSKRMIDILNSLGDFEHELIPCEIFDFSIPHEKVFEDRSKWLFKPSIELNKDYYALRPLCDFVEMDYEKSEYETLSRNPKKMAAITKLVLKEVEGGLPPLFRIKEKSSSILVTESVKVELEAAGLRGLLFRSRIL
ncbi:hypothetical protein [Spirochaeta cellobiosiphila]|uniref:hypothetical protein n=1 Tax=Spirochaeta cellobiosiphila TaxID=504483 RepID=UPI0003FCC11B|nr:hypothetical protein [Spirochaeta cellobiosiphila]